MSRVRSSNSGVRYPSADRAAHRAHVNAAYPACPLCVSERTNRMFNPARPRG